MDPNLYTVIVIIIIIILILMWNSTRSEMFSSVLIEQGDDAIKRLQMELDASRLSARQSQLSFEKIQHNIRKITPTTKDYTAIVKPFSTELQLMSTDRVKNILDTTNSTILNQFKQIGKVSDGKESYQLYSSVLLDSVTTAYSYYILYKNNTKVPLDIKIPLENNDIIHVPDGGIYKVIIE